MANEAEALWRYHKYVVMMHGYEHYNHIKECMKSHVSYETLEEEIFKIYKQHDINKGALLNTFSHLWGYFKKYATNEEKDTYMSLYGAFQKDEASDKELIDYIRNLVQKYDQKYLKQSYIMQFNG
ncbi:DUF1722 domain-containing protein [Staphylococcus massiliensis]|uniref:DUF1722 domain-containing protein n=1 Tax=Staphylococcus massiliensis S46 TaxID=1229783 RepID=K9B8P9_9STAP|nr:DUF1722 domain-containing protein [Staphylococcus massiliensis]EKU50155.1 hypothetical protein C273_02773 [Staphylococcus massiliensis S46]MCG3399620.1 YbgA family protein [Staphylococcus massiliensis]MCG3402131.1 YbgA family protein [Staphylococcus massiliensis]MCG3413299.1 YbgA family protein [Staphylococcus massiliensis]POA00850.1 DUF1722 domain-containing protein [Staphylococcus massiliensis CCUG 55927]